LGNVLFDDQHRDAFRTDVREPAIEIAHDNRGEAERKLVADQKPGIGHQRSADRDHLLLSAGQRATKIAAAL
jgi:hypothetical protein